MPMVADAPVRSLTVSAWRISTDRNPAADTVDWDAPTIIVVAVEAGGQSGLGYTGTGDSVVEIIQDALFHAEEGKDAFNSPVSFRAMQLVIRSLGRSRRATTAVDASVWDLKIKLLDTRLPLGKARDEMPFYRGGRIKFYDDVTLEEQLIRWVEDDGCAWVKIKIGMDPNRVAAARYAISSAGLSVGATNALTAKQAPAMAARLAESAVTWFEETVASDDRTGLRRVREQMVPSIDVTAGDYISTLDDACHLLANSAEDVLQRDAPRCGITGFLAVPALAEAFHIKICGHCAPALHLHPACAVRGLRNLEWFHEHVRPAPMLSDGAPVPKDGKIAPDLSGSGLGLDFKRKDAERHAL